MQTTAYLLFILLLDAQGQPLERHLRLPADLVQCRQWEQQETAALLAIRQHRRVVLKTTCEAVTTQAA